MESGFQWERQLVADSPPLPEGFTLDQPQSNEVPPLPPGFTLDAAPKAQEETKEGMLSKFVRGERDVNVAIGETAANLATGAASGLIGGLVYLGGLATGDADKAKAMQEATQSALTYHPRSKYGKAAVKGISTALDYAVEKPSEYLGNKTAELTGSPALGAAVKTGIQAIPLALGPKVLKGAGVESTAAETAAEAASKAKEYVNTRTALSWDDLSEGFKKTLTEVAKSSKQLERLDPKAVERQARLGSLPAPVPATRGQITRDPVQLRNEGNVSATDTGRPIRDIYVAQNKALIRNLEILKGKVKGTGKTASKAETPEQVGQSVQDSALREKLRLQQKNVKDLYQKAEADGEMQGTVSIEPVEKLIKESPDLTHLTWVESWLNKVGVRKSSGKIDKTTGLPLNDDGTVTVYHHTTAENANSIRANGTLKSEAEPDVYATTRKNTDTGYGDTSVPIKVKPSNLILDDEFPGGRRDFRLSVGKPGGTLKVKIDNTGQISLKVLEDLRQAAVAKSMNGGTDGYYAGKVIRAIDQSTEGAGGTSYKAARAARKKQAIEFEDQSSVARLVENKSRTDRATALEDTWRKTVLGGSIDDLRRVKRSLLTGGTPETRTAGRRAWRDMRAQTIQHITDEATKSVARFEDGTPNVTPAAMERAIKIIGADKLEEIFGPGTVKQIDKIMEATRDVKTEPPTGFKGSPTFANIITFLERGIGRIPVLGDTATGAIRGVANLHEMGKAGREVKAAQQTPLDESVSSVRRENTLRRYKTSAEEASSAATATTPLTLKDENK
jgi:hypothetical protein